MYTQQITFVRANCTARRDWPDCSPRLQVTPLLSLLLYTPRSQYHNCCLIHTDRSVHYFVFAAFNNYILSIYVHIYIYIECILYIRHNMIYIMYRIYIIYTLHFGCFRNSIKFLNNIILLLLIPLKI